MDHILYFSEDNMLTRDYTQKKYKNFLGKQFPCLIWLQTPLDIFHCFFCFLLAHFILYITYIYCCLFSPFILYFVTPCYYDITCNFLNKSQLDSHSTNYWYVIRCPKRCISACVFWHFLQAYVHRSLWKLLW